ncbi:type IV pilus biogenesis protein PilM [Sporosarcina sp. HYO08]|uniref:type IV pilus biogenesis protein PilM n=1 Tax=Sporosarcina sp. HYO08 TaxID=1759557 RepID=UPI000793DBB1|nr:pilus assembly protein PilM [Sporosarcina sp. HYO08]KXH87314.1 hypothetical protein AU377_01700 [Sporosarcina sp. HYO08]
MFRRKRKRTVSLEMDDFAIRALVDTTGDLSMATVHEVVLKPGVIVDEEVKDELALFDTLKTFVKEWNISKSDVRFFTPDHSVMMRAFTHPDDVATEELKAYVEMEIGQTIHLPFDDPLIDVYDHVPDDGEAVLFAAPSDEIYKAMQLFEDVGLHPTILDVRTLSNIRFLKHTSFFKESRTYLLIDWSIHAAALSIYTDGNVEFLRYQPTENPSRSWRYSMDKGYTYEEDIEEYRQTLINHLFEIERILNFYRFSLNKGEESVDDIVMMGDNPEMTFIVEQLKTVIDLPVHVIDDVYVQRDFPQFEAKHAALIGLALRGRHPNNGTRH